MEIFRVGGSVRDKLLGYPYTEQDWVVVGATPEQMIDQGYQQVGKDFPVFLHPETKEEYALARTERKTGPGHTGFSCHSSPDVSLEEDLKRRDLTINALAEDADGNIIDPYSGRKDLDNKLLRHVSDAFTEDPLRVLRTARFYARYYHLGFSIADETILLMQNISKSGELANLPAERIWKELEKALDEGNPAQFFIALDQCDALTELMPELAPLSEPSTQKLNKASELKFNKAVRFAALFSELSLDHTQSLTQRIKAPTEFSDLAKMISQYSKQCCEPADAEQQIRQLEQLDAYRREERFFSFLQCCELFCEDKRNIQQLRDAYDIASQIKAAQFVENGLSGKAIGEALYKERVNVLKERSL